MRALACHGTKNVSVDEVAGRYRVPVPLRLSTFVGRPRTRSGKAPHNVASPAKTTTPAVIAAVRPATTSKISAATPVTAADSSTIPMIAIRWASATLSARWCRRNKARYTLTGACKNAVAPTEAETVARYRSVCAAVSCVNLC
jgi:hypothetical protein